MLEKNRLQFILQIHNNLTVLAGAGIEGTGAMGAASG
jgi:hypothetical protein